MEYNENYGNTVMQETLQLNPTITAYLNETRKWALFLSIVGFIGLLLMIGIGLFFSFFMTQMGNIFGDQVPMAGNMGGFMGAIYIVIAILYFFPVYYTYRFSVDAKSGLTRHSEQHMTSAFKNLKSLFKFMGVFTLVIISIYVLVIVGMIILGIGTAVFS